MKAAYGVVTDIRPIASQGVTKITIEVPIECHVEATKLLYDQQVLVTLANGTLGAYGIVGAPVTATGDEETEPELSRDEQMAAFHALHNSMVKDGLIEEVIKEARPVAKPKGKKSPVASPAARDQHTQEKQGIKDLAKHAGAKFAGELCKDAKFQRWLREVAYRSHWKHCTKVGRKSADVARHVVLIICKIEALTDLDSDQEACARFEVGVRRPFVEDKPLIEISERKAKRG